MAPKKSKLTCPECDQKFVGPAGLGSHRRSKHGVEGSSSRAKQYRKESKTTPNKRVIVKPTITKETPDYSLPNDLKLDDIEMVLAIFDNKAIANSDMWFRAARIEVSVKDSQTLFKLVELFSAETFEGYNVTLWAGGRHFMAKPESGQAFEIDVQVDD